MELIYLINNQAAGTASKRDKRFLKAVAVSYCYRASLQNFTDLG